MTNSFNVYPEILDLIKSKTDVIPSNWRGHSTWAYYSDILPEYYNVVDVTGHGKIHMITVNLEIATDRVFCLLNLDGLSWDGFEIPADTNVYSIIPRLIPPMGVPGIQAINETSPRNKIINLEFDTSLLFQLQAIEAVTGHVYCSLVYSLDS